MNFGEHFRGITYFVIYKISYDFCKFLNYFEKKFYKK